MTENRCPCGRPAHHGGLCSYSLDQMDLDPATRECVEDLMRPEDPDDLDEGMLEFRDAMTANCNCCLECTDDVCDGVLQGAPCDQRCTCDEREDLDRWAREDESW